MKALSELEALVSKLPDPGGNGMLHDIREGQVEEIIGSIQEGGQEYVNGLIEMLVPPGEGDDCKPRYALHCLAVRVSGLEDDRPRRQFAAALASHVGGDRPKAVQKHLIRELQVAGGREAAGALRSVLTDEELCEPAAQALVAIGGGSAGSLSETLSAARGKCRLTLVQTIGMVRDDTSVDALKQVMDDEDAEVRMAAVWALANMGSPSLAGVVLEAADAAEGYERIKNTKAALLLAEKLAKTGKKTEAARIYSHLQKTRTDEAEAYVRDAAAEALAATGG